MLAIGRQGNGRIGGPAISERPVQSGRRMIFGAQFSPALDDWQLKTADILRFTIPATTESSECPKRKVRTAR